MLVAQAANPGGTAPSADPFVQLSWELIFPTTVAFIFGSCLWVLLYCQKKHIAEWLDASPAGRIGLPIAISVLGLISGASIDIIDVSELIDGNIQQSLFWSGPFLVFPGMALIGGLFFTWYRDHTIAEEQAKNDLLLRAVQASEIRDLQIRKLVGEKKTRIREAGQLSTINNIRDILAPASQLAINLGCLHACMYANRDLANGHSLVITIYVPSEDNNMMVHCLSTDGALHQHERDRIARHTDRFQFPVHRDKRCIVTHAAANEGLWIVQDSTSLSEAEQQYFELFYSDQHKKIRSAFAFGLTNGANPPYAVIMGYSDAPASFSDPIYPIAILKRDLESFADRIALELDLLRSLHMETPS